MASLVESWRRLPRAARWAVLAGVGVLGYFYGVEKLLDRMNKLNQSSQILSVDLQRLDQEREKRRRDDDFTEEAIARFGLVSQPDEEGAASQRFNESVTKILGDLGITKIEKSLRPATTLTGRLNDVIKSAKKEGGLESVTMELSFEAPTETIAEFLAALERTPEVTTIPRLQIRSLGSEKAGRLMRATITAEAWQLKKGTRKR